MKSTRRQLIALGLMGVALGLPAAGFAADDAAEKDKKPFIDRDGDGIRDGEEERFRARRKGRKRGRGKSGESRQRRQRRRGGN